MKSRYCKTTVLRAGMLCKDGKKKGRRNGYRVPDVAAVSLSRQNGCVGWDLVWTRVDLRLQISIPDCRRIDMLPRLIERRVVAQLSGVTVVQSYDGANRRYELEISIYNNDTSARNLGNDKCMGWGSRGANADGERTYLCLSVTSAALGMSC